MSWLEWPEYLCFAFFMYHFRHSNPMKAVCICLVRTKNVKLGLLFVSLSWLSGGPGKFSGVEGCVLHFTVTVPLWECSWTIPRYTQEPPYTYVQHTTYSVCVTIYKPWLLLSQSCFVLLVRYFPIWLCHWLFTTESGGTAFKNRLFIFSWYWTAEQMIRRK